MRAFCVLDVCSIDALFEGVYSLTGQQLMEESMRKLVAGITLAFALALPGAAMADPGGEGQNCIRGAENQNFCGDTVKVVPATPAECPNGGWTIVVNEGRDDEASYPVCNGANGQDGSDGADGADGQDGASGQDGQDGLPGVDGAPGATGAIGATGAAGAAGVDGANGSNGSNGRDGKDGNGPSRCNSNRKFVLNIWADKGDVVRNLKAEMRGKKLKLKRISHRHWQVTFSMKGFRRGVYGVRVSATVNGKPEREVHVYRACYGKGTGLNPFTIVRL